ncbi:MAG: CoA-binding protein [Rhodopirellula sp.]|nr:CoA-binding protein [Rhodopirellula sp.]
MTDQKLIETFLAGDGFAVVGASSDRDKYGNKVLRAYLQNDRKAYPVNPKETEVEGVPCFPDLASLPQPVHGVSIITPPKVTESVLEQAAAAGIRRVWMQPGAEPADWRQRVDELGLTAIGGGPCVLVTLRYRE